MMGVVFTELLEAAEARYGLAKVDAALTAANTETGGSYTAVARYDHRELVRLLVELSKATGESLGALVQEFARHLLPVFLSRPEASAGGATPGSVFELLDGLEPSIHATVRKLHPDAAPPRFECTRDGERMVVRYHSHRCLGDFAHAMLTAAAEHFGETINIERRELSDSSDNAVEFVLTPAA